MYKAQQNPKMQTKNKLFPMKTSLSGVIKYWHCCYRHGNSTLLTKNQTHPVTPSAQETVNESAGLFNECLLVAMVTCGASDSVQ